MHFKCHTIKINLPRKIKSYKISLENKLQKHMYDKGDAFLLRQKQATDKDTYKVIWFSNSS